MSAANLSEAIGNFKAAAGSLRAFVDLADKLEGLGDLEKAEKEIGGVLASKQREMADIERRIEELKEQASGILDEAKRHAGEAVENGRVSGEQAVAAAKSKAAEIVRDAQINADAANAAADDAALRAAESAAKASAASDTLVELEAKIAVARENIAALLKG